MNSDIFVHNYKIGRNGVLQHTLLLYCIYFKILRYMKLSILWTFIDLEIKIAKAMAPFKTFLKSCLSKYRLRSLIHT